MIGWNRTWTEHVSFFFVHVCLLLSFCLCLLFVGWFIVLLVFFVCCLLNYKRIRGHKVRGQGVAPQNVFLFKSFLSDYQIFICSLCIDYHCVLIRPQVVMGESRVIVEELLALCLQRINMEENMGLVHDGVKTVHTLLSNLIRYKPAQPV